jgi:acetyltransferase-like isoleucine patch superfamily enzyme
MPLVTRDIYKRKLEPQGFSFAFKDSFEISENARFEAPCQVNTTPAGIDFLGAYSYINGPGRFSDVSIGRYCSLAIGISCGYPEHPTDWLSTTSLLYSGAKWAFAAGRWPLQEHTPVRPTTIGNDVWIGVHAFIRSGVSVGDGAVIGAHAVVTKDVEPYAVVAGNPARQIRKRFSEDTIVALQAVKWWEFSLHDLRECPFKDIDRSIAFVTEMRAQGAPIYKPAILSVATLG